ncbi:hypothetical protein ABK040_013832 [Willaertia magna]
MKSLPSNEENESIEKEESNCFLEMLKGINGIEKQQTKKKLLDSLRKLHLPSYFLSQPKDTSSKINETIISVNSSINDEELLIEEIKEQNISFSLVELSPPLISNIPSTIKKVETLDPNLLRNLCHQYPGQSSETEGYQASEFQQFVLNHMDTQRKYCGHSIGLMILATGLGKTILAILDIQREIARIKETDKECKDFKFLFLVHSRVIRDATFVKFKNHFSSFFTSDANFLNVNETELNTSDSVFESKAKKAKFIFCLFQSFDKLSTTVVGGITHCIIDEVHHLIATTYHKVHQTLMESLKIRYVLGMTATLIHRDDPVGEKLKKMFREAVYINLSWNLAKTLGFFPTVEYLEYLPSTLQSNLEIKIYDQMLKECFNEYVNPKKCLEIFIRMLDRSLAQVGMNNDEQVRKKLNPEYVANSFLQLVIEQKNANLPPKRKTIIFTNNCDNADKIASLINKESKSLGEQQHAHSLHYKLGTKKIKSIIEEFNSGKINVLVNVMMVNEGFDVKDVDCLVLARQTESETVFIYLQFTTNWEGASKGQKWKSGNHI